MEHLKTIRDTLTFYGSATNIAPSHEIIISMLADIKRYCDFMNLSYEELESLATEKYTKRITKTVPTIERANEIMLEQFNNVDIAEHPKGVFHYFTPGSENVIGCYLEEFGILHILSRPIPANFIRELCLPEPLRRN